VSRRQPGWVTVYRPSASERLANWNTRMCLLHILGSYAGSAALIGLAIVGTDAVGPSLRSVFLFLAIANLIAAVLYRRRARAWWP
jgi:hypothetical protein